MVLKSTTAHLFHVGDSRIHRLRDGSLERLTEDHRVWVAQERSYLSRALGINPQLEIDYQSLPLAVGDLFVFTTDGVHEFLTPQLIVDLVQRHGDDLDAAAKLLVAEAYERGSDDNLTAQILRIDELPEPEVSELHQQRADLPFAPELAPRMMFDGFTIVRELHSSSRSHVWLATDGDDSRPLVIKALSIEQQGDSAHVERFLMEEWIARRIHSAHVAKAPEPARKRNFLYAVSEYIDGQTLAQWMIDNPRPSLETVRGNRRADRAWVAGASPPGDAASGFAACERDDRSHGHGEDRGFRVGVCGRAAATAANWEAGESSAFARRARWLKMRRNRRSGALRARQRSLQRSRPALEGQSATSPHAGIPLGAIQYAAPEYFLGEPGTPRSDLFSLAVITYQMLSGRLPYGTDVPKARTRAAQDKLHYRSVLDAQREIPAWIDEVLRRALQPDLPTNATKSFLSSCTSCDIRRSLTSNRTRPALIERDPVMFWKVVALGLLVLVVVLVAGR